MGGRQKGSVAEREVASLVAGWWCMLEPQAQFVRTPLSGGWQGPTVRAAFEASGDLMTTAKCFPFTVEVKRREAWSWDVLLAGKPSPVWEWWRQAQDQAVELGKVPMLWFRRNREPWRVFLPRHYYETKSEGIIMFPVLKLWQPIDLARVNYGNALPACFMGDTILGMHPRHFALAAASATTLGGGAHGKETRSAAQAAGHTRDRRTAHRR